MHLRPTSTQYQPNTNHFPIQEAIFICPCSSCIHSGTYLHFMRFEFMNCLKCKRVCLCAGCDCSNFGYAAVHSTVCVCLLWRPYFSSVRSSIWKRWHTIRASAATLASMPSSIAPLTTGSMSLATHPTGRSAEGTCRISCTHQCVARQG